MKRRMSFTREYVTTNYYIIDNPRLKLRRGDIILLPNRKWVPKYAKEQFAVVLERYRQTRSYSYVTYYNYKTKVMMLTGSKKGHVRTYGSPYGPSLNTYQNLYS